MAAPFARTIQMAANAPAALPALRSGQAKMARGARSFQIAVTDG